MANGAILFDANDLQTFNRTTQVGIITDHIDYASIPDKLLSIFGLAHANQSTIPFVNYPSKSITITGTVAGSSESDLDSRLDTFRSYFLGKDKNLDINTNGALRRYCATVNASTITVNENKRQATFSIQFFCIIPFGSDTATTTALNGTARTLNTYSDSYTFLGTAPVQLPVVTITLTAVSATGLQQMAFGNSETGQTLIVSKNGWTAGDVVVFDCVLRKITINGIEVDFSGAFPEFTPGAHIMLYNDTFTSRTMTENVVYYKRYL